MTNKSIFAANLRRYMALKDKTRKEVSEAIGVSYFTFCDWVNGKKYPRMDKVETLANYFGILKSDLIEEKTEEHREMQKKNDTLTDIVVSLRTDAELASIFKGIIQLNAEQRASVKQIVEAFLSMKG